MKIKNKKIIKDKKASQSIIETLISISIITIVLMLFFASANGIFISYKTEKNDIYTKNIDLSEQLIKDPGRSYYNNENWDEETNPEESLSVLGLAKILPETEIIENYDIEIFSHNETYQERLQRILKLYLVPVCFLAGTQVLMANNTYKNIENIQTGELVTAYNTQTTTTQKVTKTYHHTPQEMTDYYITINQYLKVTPNHKLYANKQWKYAADLKIGDQLGIGENTITITNIQKTYQKQPTYDLEIENDHNYMVKINNDDTLVHNTAELKMDIISGHWWYNQTSGQWEFVWDEPPPPRIIRVIFPGSPEVNYRFSGGIITETSKMLTIYHFLKMLKHDPYTYGILDLNKIQTLNNYISYENATKALGIDPSYKININIIDSEGNYILNNYGEPLNNQYEIITSYTRDVVVDDTPAVLVMHVFK